MRTPNLYDDQKDYYSVADDLLTSIDSSLKSVDGKTTSSNLTVDQGTTYAAGSSVSAAAGSNQSLMLDNPAGSGKKAIIKLVTAYTDEVGALTLTYVKGGTSTGTVLTPFNLLQGAGAVSSVLVAKFGTNVLTGGHCSFDII